MDDLDREALASDYQGEDDLDREALEIEEEKCPYCGNAWDDKYAKHTVCGMA